MVKDEISVLTEKQLADYEDLGFVHAIPILSESEVRDYTAEVEATCQAIGDRVTRLDGAHVYFRWAWDLSTHPRVLNCMEQLLGPNILLKSTRLFYKHGRSASFVGWHQDGITERLKDAQVPAIWLGLTAASVENGCLRVVPRSHRLGLVPHASLPDSDNLTAQGVTAQAQIDSPLDVVMRPGEMVLLHPLVLHSSNPNRSVGPRIGFSATYANRSLAGSRTAIAWVRGNGPTDCFDVVDKPPSASLTDSVDAYRARNHQMLFCQTATQRDATSTIPRER
jgi:non-haem Fe2+, alpha-ketoglutarate-dependent halogenase